MTIACHQTAPIYRDIAANLNRIASLVDSEADVHIFPELALTGYLFTEKEELIDLAQSVTGEAASAIADIARTKQVAIITGFLELASGKLYNTSVAFDRYGRLVGHYRKVHLFYLEKLLFEPGDLGFPIFEIESKSGEKAKFGMLICYDWRFPEAARSLAIQGAQIIAIPSNIVTTTGMLHTTLKTRAFENKVYVAVADRVGSEIHPFTPTPIELNFQGQSAIIGFNGSILAEADSNSPTRISAEIHPDETLSKRINDFNDIMTDRQPETYSIS